ncbi:urate oxidase [Cokeromyces recurvatus]|uniref:urate oxidase n=1 Tax=Cokeromyces recurvatus TaxID=90255 RepID=UPI00221E40F4|nr:urate oxidase [Cokeromyces recurvatus]KAI7907260.1 urate oxidase [Cokeromyces recurvatus]
MHFIPLFIYFQKKRKKNMPNSDNVYLKKARYGKDLVHLLRVYKEENIQHCTELTVKLLLEGDIETSYTKANNSVVVTTDTCKNTINILAKKSPHVDNIEIFAQEITEHILRQYTHISAAFVDIIKHRWSRLIVDGQAHPYAFHRDGEDVQTTHVEHYRAGNQIHITSGLDRLLVLKTTGSTFYNFLVDQYTTLEPTWDRIFSTMINCKWTFHPKQQPALQQIDYKAIHAAIKQITCDIFAKDDSASVQATLYMMQQHILSTFPEIAEVSYALPNKHYVGIDLSKFNINNKGKHTTLFHPQADPSGLITATAARKESKL